MYMNMKEVYFY